MFALNVVFSRSRNIDISQYHWSLAGKDQYPLFFAIAVIGLFYIQKTRILSRVPGRPFADTRFRSYY